jgi:hypothetical protein
MSDGWYNERCGISTGGPVSPGAPGDSQLWSYLRVCGVQILVRSSFHSLIRESSQRAISAEKYLR